MSEAGSHERTVEIVKDEVTSQYLLRFTPPLKAHEIHEVPQPYFDHGANQIPLHHSYTVPNGEGVDLAFLRLIMDKATETPKQYLQRVGEAMGAAVLHSVNLSVE